MKTQRRSASLADAPGAHYRRRPGQLPRRLRQPIIAAQRLGESVRRSALKLRRGVIATCGRRVLPVIPLAMLLKIVSRHRETVIIFHGGWRKLSQRSLCYPALDDAGKTVDELCKWASGGFVRGFQHAQKGEIHQAASALFDWTHDAADVIEARVFDGGNPPRPRCCGYIFRFGRGLPSNQIKLEFLIDLFASYEKALADHRIRYRILAVLAILEALGFVLYRSMVATGEYDRAIEFVQRGSLGRNLIAVLQCGACDQPFVTTCHTSNEIEKFIGQSAALDRHAFVRGLRRALVGEIYDAAYSLFDWIFSRSEIPVNAYFSLPPPCTFGYPVFELGRVGPETPEHKIELLIKIFDAYERALGNHPPRYAILEAIAFALSRGMGALGRYDQPIEYVKCVLKLLPRSIYLNACLHALELKARGSSVPRRLEKFCGRDPKALDHVVCAHPFTRLEVTPDGHVYVCCSSLVPINIGNIENASAAEIVHSEKAQKMRLSVLDGSYKYCNHLNCPLMIRDQLPKKTDADVLDDPVLGPAISTGRLDIAEIRHLAFGYDWSCNLSCPSCRRETVVDHHKQSSARSYHVRRHLLPLLTKLESLYINNSGEFLFSRPSRELLQSIDPAQHTNLKIDLISNGTLFSEREWQKFSNIHGMVRSIRISADAATKETFEAVRRGGRWEGFVENLRFIAAMRRRGEIECFKLAFTYQLRNFREMPAFVAFAEDLAADMISFERLAPSESMSYDEYSTQAVHLPTHPLHAQFLDVLADHALAPSIVLCEFESDPKA